MAKSTTFTPKSKTKPVDSGVGIVIADTAAPAPSIVPVQAVRQAVGSPVHHLSGSIKIMGSPIRI